MRARAHFSVCIRCGRAFVCVRVCAVCVVCACVCRGLCVCVCVRVRLCRVFLCLRLCLFVRVLLGVFVASALRAPPAETRLTVYRRLEIFVYAKFQLGL